MVKDTPGDDLFTTLHTTDWTTGEGTIWYCLQGEVDPSKFCVCNKFPLFSQFETNFVGSLRNTFFMLIIL